MTIHHSFAMILHEPTALLANAMNSASANDTQPLLEAYELQAATAWFIEWLNDNNSQLE
jgi:hypothetical protein